LYKLPTVRRGNKEAGGGEIKNDEVGSKSNVGHQGPGTKPLPRKRGKSLGKPGGKVRQRGSKKGGKGDVLTIVEAGKIAIHTKLSETIRPKNAV